MKELYGDSNVLTSSKRKIPSKFDYSIVVPIRNAVFLSIASAWAFTLNASLVVYGAHTGDKIIQIVDQILQKIRNCV